MKALIIAFILSATVLYAETAPEFSVKLGGKARSLADIEKIVSEHVTKKDLGFDFKGCKKRVVIDTETPDVVLVMFTSREGTLHLSATIDKSGKVTTCNVVALCGGVR